MLGSLPLLYAVALPFIFASLAIGILLSTMVQTQAQAMQMGFLFLLPNILLSGFMFPREAMPEPAQWLGAALPLTYFLQVLRGVLLKAAGPEAVWRQALVLTGFAVGVAAVAVGRFRKTSGIAARFRARGARCARHRRCGGSAAGRAGGSRGPARTRTLPG